MKREVYPNIHIPSANWLKRTLLIFPHVVRIVPENFEPYDPKEIWDFENVEGCRGESLLRRARLSTGGVWEAQQKLIGRLKVDISRDDSFVRRFSERSATLFEKKANVSPFYLHPGKMTERLIEFLENYELAWPATDDRRMRGFIRVHPLLGELVMSTLAIACARDEGFNIVAENGRVHRCLANHDDSSAYKEFTRPQSSGKGKTFRAEGNKLLEIVVFQRCDVASLTPEILGQLSADREAIEDLKTALERIARLIPSMQDEERFEERIQASVQDALRKWKSDRANMSSFARKIVGSEGAKPMGDVFKSAIEKGALPAIAGTGTVAAAGTSMLGWAAGVTVGLAVHTLTSWTSLKARERESPFRYLTQIEKAGVVFAISA